MNTLDLVIEGARKHLAGEISYREFSEGVAWASLIEQGIERPTIEQVEQRIAELATASSFIGAIPAPDEK